MPYQFEMIDVWAGTIEDRPVGLAGKLDAHAAAGVNLQFVIARRDRAGAGGVFVAPIATAAQTRAAQGAGLTKSASLRSLRIEGPDKAGLGASISRAVAAAGLNLRGFSGAAFGRKAVFYLAFDGQKDANKARQALKTVLR